MLWSAARCDTAALHAGVERRLSLRPRHATGDLAWEGTGPLTGARSLWPL